MNLRNYILLTIILMFAQLLVAQQNPGRNKEQIEAMRVAYITQELELTVEESQDFWPIYNEYTSKKKEVSRSFKNKVKDEELTEERAVKLIRKNLEKDEALLQLKKDYISKFQKVISSVKIVKLEKANMEFKRKLFGKIKRNMRKEKGSY